MKKEWKLEDTHKKVKRNENIIIIIAVILSFILLGVAFFEYSPTRGF